MAREPKIFVSHRALLGRIERKLKAHGQQLRADRHRGGVAYFLVDTKKRVIIQVNVDLEKLARKLDVLEPWERAALTPWAQRSDPVR